MNFERTCIKTHWVYVLYTVMLCADFVFPATNPSLTQTSPTLCPTPTPSVYESNPRSQRWRPFCSHRGQSQLDLKTG